MTTETYRPEEIKDLGFGSRVAQQTTARFLNRDGSFNVRRSGLPFFRSLNLYHTLITMSWGRSYFLIIGSYFLVNLIFAFGYLLAGHGGLAGSSATTFTDRFLESFFFSVQTIGTIGYGHISPGNIVANVLMTTESLVGLLGLALGTGLLFARFSRPQAKIIFSKTAIIAPYRGITALEFRIANERTNELTNVEATVMLSRMESNDGAPKRVFHELSLERKKVTFFPLHWVIVHPIVESSPLFGVTREEFEASDGEVLILLSGTDETFSQIVHTRSSYKHHEVRWGVKFGDMFVNSDDQKITVDLRKIHDMEVQ